MRVLVLSPRVAPGLLSAEAWDLVRSGVEVVSTHDDPHVRAIAAAGVPVRQVGAVPEPTEDVVWIAPPGDTSWTGLVAGPADVVHGSLELPGSHLLDVVAVMGRLRRECAWTRQQTHASLTRYLLEEAHEVLEALDAGDPDLLRDELGDLLMQVVFHAAIAADGDAFDVDDVADAIAAKLVRRNPHVFGSGSARTPEEIDAAWQAVKAQEAPRSHPLDGVPAALPALALAVKALDRADDLDTTGEDVGSRLLALAAEARDQGIDPEVALRRAVRERLGER
ncbi:nucleoside triphosphate pyrophosphohydrolase [Aeromicrobium halocynthiae]|uniref:Nucleoside triphosphate pyrophosphohydrolase n=1 Tax=Aeromicrobium halocynthiae TaxID=560557 RepID=A0ABN2VYH8_9ACTN